MITYIYLHIYMYNTLGGENLSADGQTVLDFFLFCSCNFVLLLLACFFMCWLSKMARYLILVLERVM